MCLFIFSKVIYVHNLSQGFASLNAYNLTIMRPLSDLRLHKRKSLGAVLSTISLMRRGIVPITTVWVGSIAIGLDLTRVGTAKSSRASIKLFRTGQLAQVQRSVSGLDSLHKQYRCRRCMAHQICIVGRPSKLQP